MKLGKIKDNLKSEIKSEIKTEIKSEIGDIIQKKIEVSENNIIET